MSQVTTHILDTTRGRPAAGVTIIMYEKTGTRMDRSSQRHHRP